MDDIIQSSSPLHPREIVRAGYSEIASTYRMTRTSDSRDIELLHLLVERWPQGAMVFDAGCGSGYPVAQFLAESFQVTGMDFAEEQIHLAKRRVPGYVHLWGHYEPTIPRPHLRRCSFVLYHDPYSPQRASKIASGLSSNPKARWTGSSTWEPVTFQVTSVTTMVPRCSGVITVAKRI